ncbi:hypothetical protein [Spirosoma endophyticum]|uniref:hypothetical protein n=1 Tax=Spirosoma endophyticum TaxID=662367 RepID=UPI0015A548F1|nr:hypothetical protein [Spirosoma endophyticum]
MNNNQAPLAAATRMEVRRRTFRYDRSYRLYQYAQLWPFRKAYPSCCPVDPHAPRLGRQV